ncbi:MAG: phosphopantetheine-binding protein [Planctomycetota bacterium]|nr:phosphopantetheine-binding protein [Planctomycetota bacterium]
MANTLVTRDKIEAEVRAALAATLRIEPETIDMDTSVVNGLQATSIDFLDINFRLESAFGVQVQTQLLLDHVEEQLGDGKAIDANNQITEAAASLLKLYFGEIEGIKAGMYADEIPMLVTPKIIADGMERILEHLPDTCQDCGASEWKTEDGAKVVCGACGAEAQYPDGDTLVTEWIQQVEAEHKLFAGA